MLIQSSLRLTLLAAAAAAGLFAPARAQAEGAYCRDLKAEIARAGQNSTAERYRAAAVRQQREYDRTAAYAQSLGCGRQSAFIFGDPPPAQCGALNARLAQMRANLASLQQGGADDGQRAALIARYNEQCRGEPSPHIVRPRNFFEELFGVSPPVESPRDTPYEEPLGGPSPFPDDGGGAAEENDGRPRGGSLAICVRSCDGGFFPVSNSARHANLDDLNSLCRAQCPGAEAQLYTMTPGGDLEKAVSVDGALYGDLPNALKFQKSFDRACSCRPPGKSWAEALGDAEQILASAHAKDQIVTPEQAERLSRPAAGGATLRGSGGFSPRAEPPAVAEKGAADNPSVYREVTGPDGVKRRVRVVAPSL